MTIRRDQAAGEECSEGQPERAVHARRMGMRPGHVGPFGEGQIMGQRRGVAPDRGRADLSGIGPTGQVLQEGVDQLAVAEPSPTQPRVAKVVEPLLDLAGPAYGRDEVAVDAVGEAPPRGRVPPLEHEMPIPVVEPNLAGRYDTRWIMLDALEPMLGAIPLAP